MNEYRSCNNEIEFDLIELFWVVLSKWKLILVVGLIFAAMVAGLMYVKETINYNNYQKAQNSDANTVSVGDDITGFIMELSPSERSGVENLVSLSKRYQMDEIRVNNCVCMKLDPDNVHHIGFCILVNGDDAVKNESFADLYSDYLISQQLASEIAKATGEIYEEEVVYELLEESYSIETSGYSYRDDSSAVKFDMFIPENMDSDVVINCILSGINEKTAELELEYPHKVIVTNNTDEYLQDDKLLAYQNSATQKIYDNRNALKTASSKLTDIQKAYYAKLVQQDSEYSVENDLVLDKIGFKSPHLSKKYLVIGFILGAFLVCAYFGILYLFSVKLVSAEQFANLFGGVVFGSIGIKAPNELFAKPKKAEDEIRNIAMGITLMCRQNKTDRIAIISSNFGGLNSEYLNGLLEELVEEGIDVEKLGDIRMIPDNLEKCVEIGKAVVIEGVGISINADISKQIVKAKEYNIELLGSVIL